MIIHFTRDVELEVVTDFDETTDTAVTRNERFKAGEQTEIDICDGMQPPFAREIQFGNGDVAFVTENFWKNVDIDVSTL